MNKKYLPLIVLVLLSGTASAQVTLLYDNPYNPSGGSDCQFTQACGGNFESQLAQSFTLNTAATIEAVSFTTTDPGAPIRYNWSIFSAADGLPAGPPGPISLPSDSPTVLPIVSSTEIVPLGSGQPGTFTYLNLVPKPADGICCAVNQVTIDTGPLNLAAGTYFFALESDGSEIDYEGWAAGLNSTGGASGAFSVWSKDTVVSSFAIEVIGTPASVSAPEISSSSAVGAVMLLIGGLLVLRGRRGSVSPA
jgi:hypothetical protein